MRFRGWELRPLERALLVDGRPVHVGSRAYDVLLVLARRCGKAVRKDELLEAAWPGLVVEENNVSVQVAALRKLLGAQAISTVPGIGYQLSARPLADAAPNELPDGSESDPGGAVSAPRWPLGPDLVGRETEIELLIGRTGSVPLLSITGTGGVGKTSLARAILSRQESAWRDGVHWIDLAPLRDGAQLSKLIAASLGIELEGSARAEEDLISALVHVRALIVVDNCEHLLTDVADFIGAAIKRASAVRWLATSQMPLHIQGEFVYRLGPLEVPAPQMPIADAVRCGAVALLCQRAAAADRQFALDSGNVGTAIDLCRQLDGLPLAIEMAAARIASLGLEGIYEQLGRRLRLLAGPRTGPPRHHTLRGTFDWSYDLLPAIEQKVFRRLEPFVGGFLSAMAQRLACDSEEEAGDLAEWQAVEALSALVDKSLVHRSAEEPGRFFLFESAREYAAERLDESGEADRVRRCYAQVVAGWFASSRLDQERLNDQQWKARYVPERHNVRAAFKWACETGEPDLLAQLIAAFAQIDTFVQSNAEIVQFDLPMAVLDRATRSLRAVACLELSWAHYLDGSREIGTTLALRALDDFEAEDDMAGAYRALAQLIRLYESRPGMLEHAKRSWELLQRIDDRDVPLRTRLFCTITAGLQYESIRPVARLAELEDMARRAGFQALAAICRVQITDRLLIERRFEEVVAAAQGFLDDGELPPRVQSLILNNQALALVQLGRTAEAYGPARAALRALPSSTYSVVDTFALAATKEGRMVDAALMAGYAAKVRRERDESPDPAEAAAIADTVARLGQDLARERLDELLHVGSVMSTADILALAMPPT